MNLYSRVNVFPILLGVEYKLAAEVQHLEISTEALVVTKSVSWLMCVVLMFVFGFVYP